MVSWSLSSPIYAAPACDGKFVDKTIRFIVYSQAGGGYDIYSRMIAPHYAKATGGRVVVENWPGGKGQIGVNKILSANPDGLTVGLINAAKVMTSRLLGDSEASDLLNDFTIFTRVARSRHLWVVKSNAGIDSVEQILSARPPMIFGGSAKRTSGFLATLLTTQYLQFHFNALVGIGGSQKRILALVRGDIDFFSLAYSSLLPALESGEIKAVLQISSTPISDNAVLDGVPLLGGKNGLAAQRAKRLGTNVEEAINLAKATEAFIGAGRVMVGPAGIEPELASCIEKTFLDVLHSPGLQVDAHQLNRPLDVADSRETIASLATSLSLIESHIDTLKQESLKFD